jgi:hypothetical protein
MPDVDADAAPLLWSALLLPVGDAAAFAPLTAVAVPAEPDAAEEEAEDMDEDADDEVVTACVGGTNVDVAVA